MVLVFNIKAILLEVFIDMRTMKYDCIFNKCKPLDYIVYIIVGLIGAYAILPMIMLGDEYIFTIHDNLDHYAAYIQYVHDNNLFFHFFDNYPIMGGIPGYYFLSYLSYGLSGILGWIFGYQVSQIIIRIIGVVFGYFSFRYLFNQIYRKEDIRIENILRLIAISYAVTPISPIRTLAFAIMPFVVGFFISLTRETEFKKRSMIAIAFPFLAYFNSLTLFAIAFWGVGCLVDWIRNKKLNPNLIVAFASYILGTIISDFPILFLVLHSSETNRALHFSPSEFNLSRFRELLRFGQYHAACYHHYVLMWCVGIGIVFLSAKYIAEKRKGDNNSSTEGKVVLFLWLGIIGWIVAAFIQAYSETNRKTGILLIDGFQWGRIIGWGRFLWLSMFVVVVYTAICNTNEIHIEQRNEKIKYYCIRVALGIATFAGLYYIFRLLFADMGFPDSWSSFLPDNVRDIVNILRWFAVGLFTIGIFCENKKIFIVGVSVVVLVQGLFVLTTRDSYSDTTRSVYYYATDTKDNESITIGDFYDTILFETIKKDINYSDKGVAAYGFQPAVLLYNGFRTVDGYLSIHPMKNQKEFRKVIEPYLGQNEFYQNYYDNWGGRMYLFGELDADPIRDKERIPSNLLIDTDAFKAYGGKYIVSAAKIENADELKVSLVNEYTREDSIYHLYLYQVD